MFNCESEFVRLLLTLPMNVLLLSLVCAALAGKEGDQAGVTFIINPLLIVLFVRAHAKKAKRSDFGSLAGTDCSQRLIAP